MIDDLIYRAYANRDLNDSDYVKDGLLHCGKCDTPKECKIEYRGKERIVPCLCKCEAEKREEQERTRKEREAFEKINRLRRDGIRDINMQRDRFENATETKDIIRCKRYVAKWSSMYENNLGLLFWGNTGTGKTFSAACIANALIDKGIPVLITSFPRILSASGFDREDILDRFNNFPLIVIDDLGVERQSDFALETVYIVVDERYKAGKPMIVTTNLTLDEIRNPKDLRYRRIYDRLLEMCTPMRFEGTSMRQEIYENKANSAREEEKEQ